MRQGIVAYKGIKESHPYATAPPTDPDLRRRRRRRTRSSASPGEGVDTVAVLPAGEVKVTTEIASASSLPKCSQGKTYKVEPVPTDVEVGPDGNLYVTTLGGGLGEQCRSAPSTR